MGDSKFYHRPVLLEEAVEALEVSSGGVYVDGTFGGGGHSKEILKRLGDNGRLVAFDQDEDAWKNKPSDTRLTDVHENFRFMKKFLRLHGVSEVDGVMADLGVSSYQFDTPERGFSIRFEGPLDMRMDKRKELTAEKVVASYGEQELHKMFERYGEVRNSKQLAAHIVQNRQRLSLTTVDGLKNMLAPVTRGNQNKYLAQVFQALRIEVNDEMGALEDLLEQSVGCLKPGGRLVIITFHSIEDRIVKQFMKRGRWGEVEKDMYGREVELPLMKPLMSKPIEPTEDEIKSNPRARSAKMRIGVKL